MNTRVELGQIAGIPIYLDMMFVLVLILFSSDYFVRGDSQLMSVGIVIIVGILLSILLHELGHALAGRSFMQRVSYIELTGLGGICHFERSLPRSVLVRSIVNLAGPAVNAALWFGCDWLVGASMGGGKTMLAIAFGTLARVNLWLLIFNLLPAYPLDGGRTLDAWLGAIVGPIWSVRIVAVSGMAVSALVAFWAFPTAIFLILVAVFLAMTNWQALQSVGGFGGTRR
jgi:Zn-dependent protease